MQQRQRLQQRQHPAAELDGGSRRGKPGLLAGIGGKLRHQRNAQHLQKHCRALPLKIPVQRAQPVEQRLDLPHNDGQQPRGGADRDEERERGLVLFQEQGQHSRHKHRGGQLVQQHHSS